jgi:hypothetical protein
MVTVCRIHDFVGFVGIGHGRATLGTLLLPLTFRVTNPIVPFPREHDAAAAKSGEDQKGQNAFLNRVLVQQIHLPIKTKSCSCEKEMTPDHELSESRSTFL